MTPWLAQRLPDGIVIALNAGDETLEFGDGALAGFLHSRAQLLVVALTHHREEGVQQIMNRLHFLEDR
jgi:hypothetical protein